MVYIWCNEMNEAQVRAEFVESLRDMKKNHGYDFTDEEFMVRVVNNHGDCNYGYIRVENPGLYNCLIGKNVDGSPREKVITSFEFKDETPVFPDGFDTWDEDVKFEFLKSFYSNTFQCALDEYQRYDESLVRKQMGPLFVMPSINNIEPAFVRGNAECKNHLVSSNVHPDVPISVIRSMFRRFVTDKAASVLHHKTKQKMFYPIVWRDFRTNNVHVQYNPRSTDGYFAHLMYKVCIVSNTVANFYPHKSSY